MANLKRKLSAILQFLKRKFQRKKRVRRSELLQAVRGGMFRRLEPRRVLSVNATLSAGVLDVSILSNDADTTAVLQSASATEFFVDANNNATHDAGELRALFADLNQINVSGDGNNTAFFWRDNFATAALNSANAGGNVVSINNVNSFESTATATVQGNMAIVANESVKFDGDLTITGNLNASASNPTSSLSTLATAKLNVTGTAQFSANSIDLNGATGNVDFNDLTLNSSAGTTISGAIAAEDVDINANGLVEVKSTASIDATTLSLDTLGANSDVRIDGRLTTTGNMELRADDSILLGASSSLSVDGTGNLSLIANTDNANGNGNDTIEMLDGASVSTKTGSILLSALGSDSGDISLSKLSTDSTSTSAIEIRSGANIVDGTATETANILAANGTVVLSALQGSIGGTEDIDIDATNLIFNAANTPAGVVNITDLAGGLRINGASQAGGGGSVTANSPLTISADVTTGASMTFTAGNSAAAGDTLTINNNAIVTLNSATAATLTFNAGDDIVFNSGRIVTTGGSHNVMLAADLDHAGVGSADGDRGAISQDGLLGVEVTASNLTANAATGIDLDTAVDTLNASTSSTGNIRIRETNAITLTSVTTTDGSIDIAAGGLITSTSTSASGVGGNVKLTASTGGIAATSVTAANDVTLQADSGNITSGSIQAVAGLVSLTATTGDVSVGSINAGTTVTIRTPGGAIVDAQDDSLVDITAGGLITLTAANAINGSGADDRLELAAGSSVDASSTNSGNILLRSLGGLTLTNVATQAGSIDVLAAGLITAINVNAAGAGSNVAIATSSGGINSTQVKATQNARLTATSADINSGSIEGTSGSVTVNAQAGSVTAGSVTAGTTVDITAAGINSDVTLNATISASSNVTIEAADSIRLNTAAVINATGASNITLTANSDAIDGNDADDLLMVDGAVVRADTGRIQLSSVGLNGGNVTLAEVSTNNSSASAIEIRSGANIVDGTATETANILAANGTVVLSALQGSIGGTEDIDIDATNLIFNAANTPAGVVNITDLAGGLRINGASQAGGGGSVTANSPLTISADVTTGASMTFTAGNSAAAGDTLTINNNAIVTLNSATAATLTFNAGDDIVFDSGRIVTTGGSHNVMLAADLDHAGVGSADGDRGSISQVGLLGVEVTASNLTANAATGIDLDTAVDTLNASTSSTGNIRIRETDAITLTSVTTNDGSIDVTASGTITAVAVSSTTTDSDTNDIQLTTQGAGDIIVRSVLAGPTLGDVTINAHGNIIDGDTVDDLDISGNDVNLTAGGSIGGTSSDVFKGVFNPIEVNATGNLVANAVAGAIALDANVGGTVSLTSITAYVASNGDLVAAPLFSVTNLALIADADNNGVGTLFLGPTLSVLGDLRIEGADIFASAGSIDLAANRLMVKSGRSETINVTTTILDASTFGDLIVVSSSNIELLDLDCDNVALQTLNNTGSIQLDANGSILVSDDVLAGNDAITSSSGSITLRANGAASNLTINDLVLADHGDVNLRADNDIVIGVAISPNEATDTDNLLAITTVNGNIRITADANNDLNGTGGALTMRGDARVIAGRDSTTDYLPGIDGLPSSSTITLGTTAKPLGQAEVTLLADETITLGSVQTANSTANAIRVTSFSGAIADGGDLEVNLVANQVGALATLTAVTGIGDSNAIETSLHALDVNNLDRGLLVATGDIAIDEVSAGGNLQLVHAATQANSGNLFVRVQNGSLTVPATGSLPSNGVFGVATEQGNILLQSLSSDINIGSQVQSQTGHVSLNAADDIQVDATVSTGTGGTILLVAGNSVNDAVAPQLDGVNVNANVSTVAGDLLIQSNQDVRINAILSSTNGDIGVVAGRDISAANSVNTSGNALLSAGRDVSMSTTASISAGSALLINSGGDQMIAALSATNVGLNSGASILDANEAD